MKSEFTGQAHKGWDGVANPDGPDYICKVRHNISVRIYPKGADSTNTEHGKKGKAGKYLWEIWYDDLVDSGYADTLEQAKKDSLYAYSEKCEASTEEWSWNVDYENGEEDEEEFEEGNASGLSKSLDDACKAISKEIDMKFEPYRLEFIEDKEGGALFADVFTGEMNFNIMIEGPKAEIEKLVAEKKIKRG